MRLNLMCGRRVLDGWTNVDIQANPLAPHPPEILADACSVPLPDGCADEVMVIHGFEHFYKWDCDRAIVEWRRLLKTGGALTLELPDVIKCCQNVISELMLGGKDPEQLGMWGLYGDPRECDPYMVHRWGWSPKSLRLYLKANGFTNIVDAETKWHPAGRRARDMRIEARKA